MEQDSKKTIGVARIVGMILVILLAAYFKWLLKPAINWRSEGLYFYILVVGIIAFVIFGIAENQCDSHTVTKISIGIVGIAFLIIIVGAFLSSKMLHAKKYANLINVEDGDFAEDIIKVSDMESFPILDVETAQKLGNRAIGSLERTSQYEVNDEYNLIAYKGKEYRLSPLEYQGYFQAKNSYNYGIPGYVMVDAITQKAELVKLEEPINYAPSAKGDRNLKRYLRKEYPSYIFDKFQFDIDEEGKPYYIVPVKEATIGIFGGKIVKSFIIVNASTGELEEKLPEELPQWIDHAYSLDYLMNLAENYYSYKNGFWNSIFKKEGVKNLSYEWADEGKENMDDDDDDDVYFPGYNSLKTQDGVEFFTCVTSSGNDESAVGFILANAKKGTIKFYTGEGAEESTAQKQAESLTQNYGYTSSYPLIVNVEGVPTYILALKDKAKTNMAYVMVNVENYTNAVKGETLQETLMQYRKTIGKADNEIQEESIKEDREKEETTKETTETTGNIEEIYQAIKSGDTCYFFLLENDPNLYISPISINSRQVQLKVGSNVTMKHYSSTEEQVEIVSEIIINTK